MELNTNCFGDGMESEGKSRFIEQIKHLKTIPGVAGVHIMAVAWEEVVPQIVERAGLYPRSKVGG